MTSKRVVWSEGMLLTQQHMQCFENWVVEKYQAVSRSQVNECWGIKQIVWDRKALFDTQKFVLQKLQAILPQDLEVDFNSNQHGELCFDLTQCTETEINLALVLPSNSSIRGLTGYDDTHHYPAWQVFYQDISDRHDQNRKQEVAFCRPRYQIVISGRHSFSIELPIAKLKLTRTGYVEDDQFIFPTIKIFDSIILLKKIQSLLTVLEAKTAKLKEDLKYGRVSDLQLVCLMQMNDIQIKVSRLLREENTYPKSLFVLVQDCVNALAWYQGQPLIEAIYRHCQSDACFKKLFEVAEKILGDTSTEPEKKDLDFTSSGKGFWELSLEGEPTQSRMLRLLIETHDSMCIEKLSELVRVHLAQSIHQVVLSASSGWLLEPVTKQQHTIFSWKILINPVDEALLQDTQALGCFVPESLPVKRVMITIEKG